MPYLGLVLTDLTFLEDGNQTVKEGLLNFQKLFKIFDTISTVLEAKVKPYPFPVNNSIQSFFDQIKVNDDEEYYYCLSSNLEPSSTHQQTSVFQFKSLKEAKLLGKLESLRSDSGYLEVDSKFYESNDSIKARKKNIKGLDKLGASSFIRAKSNAMGMRRKHPNLKSSLVNEATKEGIRTTFSGLKKNFTLNELHQLVFEIRMSSDLVTISNSVRGRSPTVLSNASRGSRLILLSKHDQEYFTSIALIDWLKVNLKLDNRYSAVEIATALLDNNLVKLLPNSPKGGRRERSATAHLFHDNFTHSPMWLDSEGLLMQFTEISQADIFVNIKPQLPSFCAVNSTTSCDEEDEESSSLSDNSFVPISRTGSSPTPNTYSPVVYAEPSTTSSPDFPVFSKPHPMKGRTKTQVYLNSSPLPAGRPEPAPTPAATPTTHKLDLFEIAEMMQHPQSGVKIKSRKYFFKKYPDCFIGAEAVTWLVSTLNLSSREEAVSIGQLMLEKKILRHCVNEHEFQDKYLFYVFIPRRNLLKQGAL